MNVVSFEWYDRLVSLMEYTFVACPLRPSQHGAELEQIIVVDGM